MAGVDFIGRRRPPWKILAFSLITLGVYARVYLFKTAREMDGHHVFFLDLRLYRVGVILPVVGPFIVKWKLASLLPEFVRHDVTAQRVPVRRLRWLALVPWIPFFHMVYQRHLDAHWALHRKLDNLEALKEVLEERRKAGRSKAALEEVERLELEVREREKTLRLAREAALSIRDAQEARRKAQAEVEAARRAQRRSRRFPLGLFGRQNRSLAGEEPGAAGRIPLRRRFGRPEHPSGGDSRSTNVPPGDSSEPGGPAIEESTQTEAGGRTPRKKLFGLMGRRERKAEPVVEPGVAEPSAAETEVAAPKPSKRKRK